MVCHGGGRGCQVSRAPYRGPIYLGRAVLSAPGGPYKGIIGEIREIHKNQLNQQKLDFAIMWQL